MAAVTLQEELRKNAELTEDDVAHLRQWNSKQSHLPAIPDEQLVLFLHSCHWSLERAKATIDTHYSMRTFAPEIFSEMDPLSPTLQEAFNVYEVSILPRRDQDDNLLLCLRMRDHNPSRMDVTNMIRLQNMLMMLSWRLHGTSPGYRLLFDMTGYVAGHTIKLLAAIPLILKYALYLQESLPLRLKSIHVLNSSSAIDSIMNLVRPALSNDLFKLIHFHKSGMEEFYNYVPKELLPMDYGGYLGNLREMTDNFRKVMEKNQEWFVMEQTMKSDESKRVGKPKFSGELFGVEGSFKKLEID